MEGDVPVEIAGLFGAAGKVFDEGAGGKCLLFVAAGVADVPMMFEGKVNPRIGGMFADGGVGGANGAEVIVAELFHGDAAHVRPEPVGVHFVADDVIEDAAMR